MENYRTIGEIKVRDKYNIPYSVCYIEYIEYEDESFKYIFKPHYNIIKLTNFSFFQGIPGLNLELKKDEYIRENKIPTFISERCPMKNRENLYEELQESGLDYYNPLQWLINTNLKYSGDHYYVEKYQNNKVIYLKDLDLKNSINLNVKLILEYICGGFEIHLNELIINDDNRQDIYNLLINLYSNSYYFHKKNKNKVGRKKTNIDILLFYELYENYQKGKVNVKEICESLSISRATFYRLVKEYINNQI